MNVYTVQPGDTIDTIAEKFNVPSMRLLQQNIIQPNNDLIVGQNLIITHPERVYYIEDGDTLQSIAEAFGVPEQQLLHNNPQLTERDYFYIGEEIIVSYSKEEKIEVNGYAFSYIEIDALKITLPYLTYLTIPGYKITITGDIIAPEDKTVVEAARAYGVAPLMMCSTLNIQGQGNYEIIHTIVNDSTARKNYIANVLHTVRENNLAGVNFGCTFILKEDLQNYILLMAEIKLLLQQEGYIVIITCDPVTYGFDQDGKNDTTYFYQVGQIADRVILISYQWTHTHLSLVGQTTIPFLEKYVQYAVTQIPSEKILVGITRVVYDWELPYVEDKSNVNSLTNSSSLELANEMGVDILFDVETQTPYFYYKTNEIEHFVWFKDAKTTISILNLVKRYYLGGVSVWSIMDYEPQIWSIINSTFEVIKV